jgi:alpha-tubulin suppressor-like RCC1 family protein
MDRKTLSSELSSRSPNRLTGFQSDRSRPTEKEIWLSNMSEEEIRKKRAFVWGWGKNKNGELSLGVTKDALFPRLVKGLNGKVIVFISSGANHTAAITSDGELIVWGSYLHDKLGIEDLRATNVLKFTPSTYMRGLSVK